MGGSPRATVSQAGLLVSLHALGVVPGAPVITALCARMPRHRLLMGMMALSAVGDLVSASSDRLSPVGLFRFLSGLPHGASTSRPWWRLPWFPTTSARGRSGR